MTVDQRRSRRSPDLVPDLIAAYAATTTVRPFDRTAGDEVQAVFTDPEVVVDVALDLAGTGRWSVGIGVGPVDEPLPSVTRAGRGPAFENARVAVTRAKNAPGRISVAGADAFVAADATAVLALLAIIVARRSPEGQDAVRRIRDGASQTRIADDLGISKQAVSQRLAVAEWQAETAGRTAAARLLSGVDVSGVDVSGVDVSGVDVSGVDR